MTTSAEASAKKGYWNGYVAGVALGLVLFASFLLTGHGLGASGGIARAIAAVQSWIVPAHVDGHAGWAPLAGGSRNALDHWLVWAIIGTATGGFVSGLMAQRVKLQTFKGPRISKTTRWMAAFAGGMLVGWAARMARGCTSGQALSGGAVLAVGSWAFMFSVFAGGYALAYLVRRLWI